MAEIPETAITWTHDDGQIHIDTRSAKVANRLRRLGVEPITNDMPVGGYASFRTDETKVRIVLMAPRPSQDLSEEERQVRRERMMVVNAASRSQNPPKEAP